MCGHESAAMQRRCFGRCSNQRMSQLTGCATCLSAFMALHPGNCLSKSSICCARLHRHTSNKVRGMPPASMHASDAPCAVCELLTLPPKVHTGDTSHMWPCKPGGVHTRAEPPPWPLLTRLPETSQAVVILLIGIYVLSETTNTTKPPLRRQEGFRQEPTVDQCNNGVALQRGRGVHEYAAVIGCATHR